MLCRSLKLQFFTVVTANIMAFWNLTPCTLVHGNEIFGGSWLLYLQDKAINTEPTLYTASTATTS